MSKVSKIKIFSYNTISTSLIPETKSLEINFHQKNLNLETLFELESIYAWCATHIEVQHIILTCKSSDTFILGLSNENIKNHSVERLNKFYQKLSTIVQSMLCLPQTIIADLKNGTSGVGIEIAFACDIRLANHEANFKFDQLSQGITCATGAFSFLKPLFNQNTLRSLVMSGRSFNLDKFQNLGGCAEIDISPEELLLELKSQSPIARIQSKKSLVGNLLSQSERELQHEKNNFECIIATEDYRERESFVSVNEIKSKLNNAASTEKSI